MPLVARTRTKRAPSRSPSPVPSSDGEREASTSATKRSRTTTRSSRALEPAAAPKRTFGKALVMIAPGKLQVRRRPCGSDLGTRAPVPLQVHTFSGNFDILSKPEYRKLFDDDIKVRLAVLDANPSYPTTEDFVAAVVETLSGMGFPVDEAASVKGYMTPRIEAPRPGLEKWTVGMRAQSDQQTVQLDPDDFSNEPVTTDDLVNLAPDHRRNTSFSRALASNDAVFRRLTFAATVAANQADESTSRTSHEWLPLFLDELDQQRLPDRRQNQEPTIRITPRAYATGHSARFDLIKAKRCVERVKISSNKNMIDEFDAVAFDLIQLNDEGLLTWAYVLKIKEDWHAGVCERGGKSVAATRERKSQLLTDESCTPMMRLLHVCLYDATRPQPHSGHMFRYATDEQFDAALEHLETFIRHDPARDVDRIHCCLTGAVLLELPSTVSRGSVPDLVENNKSAVSIDHRWQVTVSKKNAQGDPTVSMSNPLNFSATTWLWNNIKHRYPYSIVALTFIALFKNDDLVSASPGVVSKNAQLLIVLKRLLDLARIIYKNHRFPCELYDRSCVPLKMAQHVIGADIAALGLLNIRFADPLPKPNEMLKAVGLKEEAFVAYATDELKSMADECARSTGKPLDLDEYPAVRPGTNLERYVLSRMRERFIQASRVLVAEFEADYNMKFIMTSEGDNGIISLSPSSSTTVDETIQAILRWNRTTLAQYGFASANPEVTLYVNSICYVASSILYGNGGGFEEPTDVFFHDPHYPALPIMIPADSKGPFAPSICSNDHPQHTHGFTSTVLDDLTFDNWDSSRNTVRLSSWSANLVDGRGDAAAIEENRAAAVEGAALLAAQPASGIAAAWTRLCDGSDGGVADFEELLDAVRAIDDDRPVAPAPSPAREGGTSLGSHAQDGDDASTGADDIVEDD